MNFKRAWPCRKLQIAVVVFIVLAALVQFLVFPADRASKSENLYVDSWYADTFSEDWNGDSDNAKAVAMLEKALGLSPNNGFYEQALVWRYRMEKLPELLKERQLSPPAERLAYARLAFPQHMSYRGFRTDADRSRSLEYSNRLLKLDPNNALAYYRKAYILKDAHKFDEMLAAVRAGNRAKSYHVYMPEITAEVADTFGDPKVLGPPFEDASRLREVARSLVDLSSAHLRQKKVDAAVEPLEECCRMGVKIAGGNNTDAIGQLMGVAVFSIGWSSLEPIYKDFGMRDKISRYIALEGALYKVKKDRKSAIGAIGEEAYLPRELPLLSLFGTLAWAAGLSVFVIVVTGVVWAIGHAIVRRRGESVFNAVPWGEGWLTRMFIAAYLPAIVLALLASSGHMRFLTEWYFAPILAPLVLVGIATVVTFTIFDLRLYKTYNANAENRVSYWRFSFGRIAPMQSWHGCWFFYASSALFAFLGCCILLMTMIYKPVVGVYPWQVDRLHLGSASYERTQIEKGRAILMKALPEDWKK